MIRVAYIHSQTTLTAVVCISHIQTIHHIIVIMWYIIENDEGEENEEKERKEKERSCMLIYLTQTFIVTVEKFTLADNSRSVRILCFTCFKCLNCFNCFIYGEIQVCSKKDDANS